LPIKLSADRHTNLIRFLGGMKKDCTLTVFKPHIFFDDQKSHLSTSGLDIPMVHIPFGIANRGEPAK